MTWQVMWQVTWVNTAMSVNDDVDDDVADCWLGSAWIWARRWLKTYTSACGRMWGPFGLVFGWLGSSKRVDWDGVGLVVDLVVMDVAAASLF